MTSQCSFMVSYLSAVRGGHGNNMNKFPFLWHVRTKHTYANYIMKCLQYNFQFNASVIIYVLSSWICMNIWIPIWEMVTRRTFSFPFLSDFLFFLLLPHTFTHDSFFYFSITTMLPAQNILARSLPQNLLTKIKSMQWGGTS